MTTPKSGTRDRHDAGNSEGDLLQRVAIGCKERTRRCYRKAAPARVAAAVKGKAAAKEKKEDFCSLCQRPPLPPPVSGPTGATQQAYCTCNWRPNSCQFT
ncbi:hypothetical protein L484_019177 [Morus notabilis]|uniref:Uncharacterized protein n=1 Tax=Morus notabilis TaxID=981085 RepID=W9QUQ2_9ROSA|nr:hypothetical protein L484_019177 [Morus notabilis]